MKIPAVIAFCLALCAPAALAGPDSELPGLKEVRASPFKGEQVNAICTVPDIAAFVPVAERAAILTRADGQAYLVEFRVGCNKLDDKDYMQIASSELCMRRGTPVRMTDVAEWERFPLRANRQGCRVDRIYEWQHPNVLPEGVTPVISGR